MKKVLISLLLGVSLLTGCSDSAPTGKEIVESAREFKINRAKREMFTGFGYDIIQDGNTIKVINRLLEMDNVQFAIDNDGGYGIWQSIIYNSNNMRDMFQRQINVEYGLNNMDIEYIEKDLDDKVTLIHITKDGVIKDYVKENR